MATPQLLNEPNTHEVLWRRHERPSDNIFIPQADLTLRSGATAAVVDFPIIPDPNTAIGEAGDVFVDTSAGNYTEFLTLINACRAEWQALDPTITGITAVHINEFVDAGGNRIGLLGLGGLPGFSSTAEQNAAGRAMVIDNVYTLPSRNAALVASQEGSFTQGLPLRVSDTPDSLVGHEVVHGLSLGHIIDSSNLMNPWLAGGTGLTAAQVTQIRDQATLHIPDIEVDPVPTPLADVKVDVLGDVPPGLEFIDIDTLSVAVDQQAATTTLSIKPLGGLPPNISHLNYFFAWDLDNNAATGASGAELSSEIGIVTAFSGTELLGKVAVSVKGGVPKTKTMVKKFISGEFVQIIDPSIQAQVVPDTIGLVLEPGAPPIGDEVSILRNVDLRFSSTAVGAPTGNDSRIIAIAQWSKSAVGAIVDSFDAQITFEVPVWPQCSVTPPAASPGVLVTVAATGLLPNAAAMVFLGDQEVGTGQTDGVGNVEIDFTIPARPRGGPRLVTVGTIAVTADCTVNVTGVVGRGGIVGLLGDDESPAGASGSSSARDRTVPIVAAATVAAVLALTAGGWYARRRWLR